MPDPVADPVADSESAPAPDPAAGVITVQVRTLRRMAVAVVGLSALFLLLTWTWFVSPSVDSPESADAIVVLGGEGDRTGAARALVADGVADEVWISSVWIPPADFWAETACRPPGRSWPIPDADVTCFEADDANTRGEARMIAEIAEQEGWDTIVVVATTDQITRARRLLERCFDGEIQMVDVSHPDPLLLRIIYEWGAGLETTLRRGC